MLIIMVALGFTPFYLPWAFKYLAYLSLAVLIFIRVSLIAQNKARCFFEKYSIEIYLLHEKILWTFRMVCSKIFPIIYKNAWFYVARNIIGIICTVLGAYILNKLCRNVILRESKT